MLFGGCNCIPDPSALGSLCAGGAGFVSAMMAAMVAGARTSEARPLGLKVPEVDRLAVRIVTDNIVIQFVPNEKRGGLTIERRGGNTRARVVALVEEPPADLHDRHQHQRQRRQLKDPARLHASAARVSASATANCCRSALVWASDRKQAS